MSQTIFSTGTPSGTDYNDGANVTFGCRFKPLVNGNITKIRYWKPSSDTGTTSRTVKLWTVSGSAQVASKADTPPSTSGVWREVTLDSPVAVTANTEYVVSVYGTFTGTSYYIDCSQTYPYTNSNLTALDGRYNWGADAYPTTDGGSSWYAVDVVFDTGSAIGTMMMKGM